LVDERAAFVGKPVSLSMELPPKPQRDYILYSLAEGKNPFGLFAFKLKAHQQVINQICVSGLPPAGTDDWRHVCIFVAFRDKVMSLSARWITLRDELSIPEEVHFDDARLSALDVIADTLQTALVDIPSMSGQLTEQLAAALDSREEAMAILRHHAATAAFGDDLARHIASIRLSAVLQLAQTQQIARVVGAIARRFHRHLLIFARERGELQRLEMISQQHLRRDNRRRGWFMRHGHAETPAVAGSGPALAMSPR
jgi:hypothetical protein